MAIHQGGNGGFLGFRIPKNPGSKMKIPGIQESSREYGDYSRIKLREQ